MENAQPTGEASNLQKRKNTFSKHEFSSLFPFLRVLFLPYWIRIQPAKINAVPDPQH
jgi:hypothetical protein